MGWIRSQLVSAVVAGVMGAAAGSSVTYYVTVVPTSAVTQETVAAIPPRFEVVTDSPYPRFLCDLTLTHDAMCRSDPRPLAMIQNQIVLKRHPGDPTRISVGVFGTRQDGLTWPELAKGVNVGGIRIRGIAPGGG